MITMGKKYQTRDGRAVRILATDVKANSYSVVGIVTEYAGGREFISEWTATGESISRMYGTHNDLIPVPTKHEGWMFVTIDGKPLNIIYPTLEAARDWEASTWVCSRGFVFLSRVTWES